ncbi:hypothetical protein OIU76_008702 [Salix suchowensis]|nr:hypothetical protein OIU76_008702 [Salix suchowensis]
MVEDPLQAKLRHWLKKSSKNPERSVYHCSKNKNLNAGVQVWDGYSIFCEMFEDHLPRSILDRSQDTSRI